MQNFISRIGQGGGGGGGGDAGAGEMWGIDTSRVLKDATTVTSSAPFTYTATENCWVRVNSSVQNGATMLVYIDNVPLGRGYSASSMVQWMNIFPLLKGQILRVTTTYDGIPGNVVIYGSKSASGESGSGGHIYSTEERLIGKWVDGKDLFEKTFILNGVYFGNVNVNLTLPNVDMALIDQGASHFIRSDSDTVCFPFSFVHGATYTWNVGGFINSNVLSLRCGSSYSNALYIKKIYLVVLYTKA